MQTGSLRPSLAGNLAKLPVLMSLYGTGFIKISEHIIHEIEV
jgi:hypothetical protein